jgi:Ca2+-binding EF-hand superfamily protein
LRRQGASVSWAQHIAQSLSPSSTNGSGGGRDEDEGPRDDEAWPEAKAIFDRIDQDGDGLVCKLDFLAAVQRDQEVDDFVLPGFDCDGLLTNERCFNAVDFVFESIARGQQRICFADFAAYFRKERAEKTPKTRELQAVFGMMDQDGSGTVSKLEFFSAMQQNKTVDEFVLPGIDSSNMMSDGWRFTTVEAAFRAIAGDKRCINFEDFKKHFRGSTSSATTRPPPRPWTGAARGSWWWGPASAGS